MRIPKVTNLSDQHRVHGARITKPIIKAPIVKKQCHEDRLLIEVKQLQSWHGRISDADEEDDSSDSDVENDRVPRSHARQYPPIVPGTQNTPWLELPGEIRNKIYEYAILAEEQKTVNIVHYPNGIPRRSIRGIASRTNFAHSAWGFTQSCRQVREEFTPWLLEKRRIRTPLATLNNYVDTFHPLNQNGKRIGWIEPICSNAPLPHDGVEILKLLQCKHNNTSFHLQLTPTTPTNMGHDLLALPTDPDQFDEIRILRDMGESFETWSGIILQSSGIDGIHIMSIVEQGNIDAEGVKDSEDDDESHDILIKLDVNQSKQSTITSQDRLRHIGRFIFNSQLDQLHGLRLQSSFDCGIARWRVTRAGTVDMQWNARKSRSKKIFRRLTNAPHEPEGFAESNLD
ncbi:hypothetical protein BKA66DRAFT_463213 [Pyrenochaeta sp. MPI-SDFR-AT-0127]|nr:hypothetical protein BKA66DRAFT_463213 [Pyrenochaeta sp. MPI-SDFR-AT-0127]